MKKLLTAIAFTLLLVLPGCNPFSESPCTLTGPANMPYLIVYPCINGACGPINDTARGTVGADGKFKVPKQGFSCSTLQGLARFGTNFGFALSASPSSVDLNSPPTSGTIIGQGFDATYGMPRVDYFDISTGFLMGSVEAMSVNSNGTSLQANLPDLSYVYSGTYRVKVTNKTYDGYYLNIVGWANMTGWGRDRPDSDGDGIYDDEDCDPYDPYNSYCPQTCGGTGDEPLTLCGPI
jgi:hypothetical protein